MLWEIVVDAFLMSSAILSAHLAGAMYVGSSQNKKLRVAAILRTLISGFLAALIFVT
jgi:hypothetical protein